MKVECKNCKGKGHVLDGVNAVCGGPFIWIVALFEASSNDGLTRQACKTCDGKGYIKT